MAQPNVVREPSMDEILASIRRIIESNDPVPSGIPSVMPEPEGFSGSPANDDMEDVPLTIDDVFAPRAESARAPMHQAYPSERSDPITDMAPAAPEPATQPQRSLSLADVAARVRAASERNPVMRDLTPKAAPDVAPTASSPLVTGRMAATSGSAHTVARSMPWDEIPSAVEEAPLHVEAEAEAEVFSIPKARVEEPAATPVSLISADAGQQVARSFQDLAVAVNEAERKSYDEIAADLLRPMLQEWLDENLPTLVERLVREEIERVARGNRR